MERGRGFSMGRTVGVAVVGLAAMAGLMLWLALALSDKRALDAREGLLFGTWRVLYDTYAPPAAVIVAAFAVALAFVAIATGVETTVMAETRGVFHGPVTITVLIPAHNEEDRIAATLTSLQTQSDPPERIIVVADNCTDATPELARAAGVEVFETKDNVHKKGGALNQALAELLPELGENDCVMVMDADTVLDQGYLTAARRRFTDDRALMAVGGLFYGEDGAGLLGQFQRNEYTRYSRDIRRRRGRVLVLTGTASVFRSRALCTVAASRGTRIPGRAGDVYDTAALTEDNELTLALKSLGGLMVSPVLHRGHRGHAHVEGTVAPATAVAAGRAGEPRRVRDHPPDDPLLVPTARHRLRRDRAVELPAAHPHHRPRVGPVGLVPVLGRAGPAVHARAAGRRVARGPARQARRHHARPGAHLRHVPQRGVPQGRGRHPPGAAGQLGTRRAGRRRRDTGGGHMTPGVCGAAPHEIVLAGILLPESVLSSDWFAVLAAFVAIDTVMYVTLAATKTLPKIHVRDLLPPRNYVRSETRSIHPDAQDRGPRAVDERPESG